MHTLGGRGQLKYLGPCHLVGDVNEALESWIWPGPSLTFAGIPDVNQWMKDGCLSLCLCFLRKTGGGEGAEITDVGEEGFPTVITPSLHMAPVHTPLYVNASTISGKHNILGERERQTQGPCICCFTS